MDTYCLDNGPNPTCEELCDHIIKTDSHDLTEILLKVALKHHKTNQSTEEMK
jgi:hypothetical protein